MSTYKKELQALTVGLKDASRLCRSVQQDLVVRTLTKRDKSPVTIADFGSQALVCRVIQEAFPADPIVAEEDSSALQEGSHADLLSSVTGHVRVVRPEASAADVLKWIDYGQASDTPDRFWTVDPVDGTKGFLRKQQYAIAIALIEQGKVVLAGLSCPNLDDGQGAIFTANGGKGALQVSPVHGVVRVSSTSEPFQARFCESVESAHCAHGDAARVARLLGISQESVRMDSQAKYAVVARGQADIYLRLPRDRVYVERIWDHAAGSLLTTEAGGRVTDCTGAPLNFGVGIGLDNNRGVVATNGILHERVIEALKHLEIGQP